MTKDTDPCWKGYKQLGMKKKDEKEVPNCVKEEQIDELSKNTLIGYLRKAESKAGQALEKDDFKTFQKRATGANKAITKVNTGKYPVEEESLNELSKNTLQSYLTKSRHSSAASWRDNDGNVLNNLSKESLKSLAKRYKGQNRAEKKLAEDTLDESGIFPGNDIHARVMTDRHVRNKSKEANHSLDYHIKNAMKNRFELPSGKLVKGALLADIHDHIKDWSNHNISKRELENHLDKHYTFSSGHSRAGANPNRRNKARFYHNNEPYPFLESLDEMSKDKVFRYFDKASQQRGKAEKKGDTKTMRKRERGLSWAFKKIHERLEENLNEISLQTKQNYYSKALSDKDYADRGVDFYKSRSENTPKDNEDASALKKRSERRERGLTIFRNKDNKEHAATESKNKYKAQYDSKAGVYHMVHKESGKVIEKNIADSGGRALSYVSGKNKEALKSNTK